MKILSLDIEATGPDPYTAKILELAVLENGCTRPVPVFHSYFNPGCPIPPEATEVHGIKDTDVADCPPFAEEAAEVQASINGAVLLGYSLRTYDTILLNRELVEAGQMGIDLENINEIDLFRVWREVESRKLTSCVKRYLGRDHEGAHGALDDAAVLPDLLDAMLEHHDLSVEEALRLSRPATEVDRNGYLTKNEDGEIIFNFGKYRGEPVMNHVGPYGYVEWMLKQSFPPDTVAALEAIWNEWDDLRREKQEDEAALGATVSIVD